MYEDKIEQMGKSFLLHVFVWVVFCLFFLQCLEIQYRSYTLQQVAAVTGIAVAARLVFYPFHT